MSVELTLKVNKHLKTKTKKQRSKSKNIDIISFKFRSYNMSARKISHALFGKLEEEVFKFIKTKEFTGCLSPEFCKSMMHKYDYNEKHFFLDLLDISERFSVSKISNFPVGALVQCSSGNIYLGANLEFPGENLSFTIHAEQGAIINAWNHGESDIKKLFSSYVPCALCRQFLNELEVADSIEIILPDMDSVPLKYFFPDSFGPKDLNIADRLMVNVNHKLELPCDLRGTLVEEALRAANRSYSPYTKSYSGVALLLKNGIIITGMYAENAAFNISMNPMAAALSNLNISNNQFEDIAFAAIVETDTAVISQIKAATNLLASVNSNVHLNVLIANKKK